MRRGTGVTHTVPADADGDAVGWRMRERSWCGGVGEAEAGVAFGMALVCAE